MSDTNVHTFLSGFEKKDKYVRKQLGLSYFFEKTKGKRSGGVLPSRSPLFYITSSSPVRTLYPSSTFITKTRPSPISPVRAVEMIALRISLDRSFGTTSSIITL